MSEQRHCEGCYVHNVCPGLPPCEACEDRERQKAKWGVYPCEQCAAKNEEIAALATERDALRGEVEVLSRYKLTLSDAIAERDRLFACIQDAIYALNSDAILLTRVVEAKQALAKWRSLEGKG